MNVKILKCYDMKEYKRQYYLENKSKWEKTETCELCNMTYKIIHRSRHNKTKKHQMLLNLKMIDKLENEISTVRSNIENINKNGIKC